MPDQVSWSNTITVPFAPETEASGIGVTGLSRTCWYRRSFDTPDLGKAERLVLLFSAEEGRRLVTGGRIVATGDVPAVRPDQDWLERLLGRTDLDIPDFHLDRVVTA